MASNLRASKPPRPPADLPGWHWEVRADRGYRLISPDQLLVTGWYLNLAAGGEAAAIEEARRLQPPAAIVVEGEVIDVAPIEPDAPLTSILEIKVEMFLDARRRVGQGVLDAARVVTEARAIAVHGQWGPWLKAVGLSPAAAERLLAMHRHGQHNALYAQKVREGFFSLSVAGEIPQSADPQALLERLLAFELPPTVAEVRAVKKQLAAANPPTSGDLDEAAPAQASKSPARLAEIGDRIRLAEDKMREGLVFNIYPPNDIVNYSAVVDDTGRRVTFTGKRSEVEVIQPAPKIPVGWEWKYQIRSGALYLQRSDGQQTQAGFDPAAIVAQAELLEHAATEDYEVVFGEEEPPAPSEAWGTPGFPERGIYLHTPPELVPADWDAWRARLQALGGDLTLGIGGVVTGNNEQRRLGSYALPDGWSKMTAEIEALELRAAQKRAKALGRHLGRALKNDGSEARFFVLAYDPPRPPATPEEFIELSQVLARLDELERQPEPAAFDYAAWEERAHALGANLKSYGLHYELVEPDGTTSRYPNGCEDQLVRRIAHLEGLSTAPAVVATLPAPDPPDDAPDPDEGDEPAWEEVDDAHGLAVMVRGVGLPPGARLAIPQIAEALRLIALNRHDQVDVQLLDELHQTLREEGGPASKVLIEVLELVADAAEFEEEVGQ